MSDSDDSDYKEAGDIFMGKLTSAEVDLLRGQLSEKCSAATDILLASKETADKKRFIEATLLDLLAAFNKIATSYLSLSAANQVARNIKASLKKSIKDEVAEAIKKSLPSAITASVGASYADMVGKSSQQPDLHQHRVKVNRGPTVIVPKTVSVVIGPKAANVTSFATAEDTRKAMFNAVKPGDLDLKVNKVVNVRNNSVRIIAEKINLEKLKSSPTLAAAGLEIKEKDKLNPRLVIRDVPTELSSSELVSDIKSFNLDDPETVDIKVVYRYPSRFKNGLASVVIETTADVRRKLLDQSRVYLQWHSCKVEDHLRILQCFKCQGFGHLAKACTSAAVCGRCAAAHETSSCTAGEKISKCVNCVANKLSNVEHKAYDATKCPLIKRRLTEKAKNISY